MPDYNQMTIEELEKANQELMEQRQKIKDEQRLIAAVLDRKQAEARAKAKVARMSDPEKAALAQVLKAGSIESAEAVGSPGAS